MCGMCLFSLGALRDFFISMLYFVCNAIDVEARVVVACWLWWGSFCSSTFHAGTMRQTYQSSSLMALPNCICPNVLPRVLGHTEQARVTDRCTRKGTTRPCCISSVFLVLVSVMRHWQTVVFGGQGQTCLGMFLLATYVMFRIRICSYVCLPSAQRSGHRRTCCRIGTSISHSLRS